MEALEEYVICYSKLLEEELEDNWMRGDIAIAVTEMYKDEKEKSGNSNILSEFLKQTGESRSAFNQYRWVAKAFPSEEVRTLPLNWTYFRICASLDDPVDWLLKAYDNKWSCSRLIKEIKANNLERHIESGLDCCLCGESVTKEQVVTITFQKKRFVVCSINCAKGVLENLQQVENNERTSEICSMASNT